MNCAWDMCCAWDGGSADDRERDSVEDDDGAVRRAIAARIGCLDEDVDFVDDDAGFAAEGDDFVDGDAEIVDDGADLTGGDPFVVDGYMLKVVGELGGTVFVTDKASVCSTAGTAPHDLAKDLAGDDEDDGTDRFDDARVICVDEGDRAVHSSAVGPSCRVEMTPVIEVEA